MTTTTYGSISAWKAYAAERGQASIASTADVDLTAALVRGSEWLDGRYRDRFAGVKSGGRAQVREWPRRPATPTQDNNRDRMLSGDYPRTGYGYGLYPATVFDRDGNPIAVDEVPAEIIKATYEAAYRELATPGYLSPDYVAAQQVASESVGPVSTSYAQVSAPGPDSIRPVLTVIDDILAPLIAAKRRYMSGASARS